ncbi:MAG: glycoside hydrolase family 3 protein [Anaerolineales bacterium]|nr:glycoside hydrolase family 3 protein [Anaerolineales bacterium]
MNKRIRVIKRCFLLLLFILTITLQSSVVFAEKHTQTLTPEQQAQILLNQLSPKEKVGQLFLVTFTGTEIGLDTQIYKLITNYHIGGVILLASNDNFYSSENFLSNILFTNSNLQMNGWTIYQQSLESQVASDAEKLHYIPLFIGISQEGDGPPHDQILSNITVLPDEMAIGATWNLDLARQVGVVQGRELSSLGFNLLLGPALDVLESPQPEGVLDLGTRLFGGDPFWVGEMGKAYISGVHEGSNNKMAVVAKHFPGNGGSDRSPEEEVATVRKSFERLKTFDLEPFFAVTGKAGDKAATTDALLASHIRYQGFQENIRATTRPISFDQQAFSQLLNLAALSTWRSNSGLIVCDNLGSQAVRRFYELTSQEYDSRRVALNAFLAGNDILYLGDVKSGEDEDSFTSTTRTLDFFTQKYLDDSEFAERVDESVFRILALKYRMYDDFTIQQVVPPESGLINVGQSGDVTYNVAKESATLISPTLVELNNTIPNAPSRLDRIVFITDVRTTQQCSQCPPQAFIAADAMQQSVIKLYGSQAGGQINPANLTSLTNDQIIEMLDNGPNAQETEKILKQAQWIVFATLNISNDIPSSLALKRFLAERQQIFQQKKLLVFAFNAPYYLDATDISKVSAYYSLYSKSPTFIDVAVRLLFRELQPNGDLPVSVVGSGFDLITATSPDPDQIIPLYVDLPLTETISPTTTTTPEAPVTPLYHVGDTINVKAGVILDHNGHSVPDGTPVEFIVNFGGVSGASSQSGTTVGGVATSRIKVSNSGTLDIRVESEPAKSSTVLSFEIPPIIEETVSPTATETPTETPTPTVTITPTDIAQTIGAIPESIKRPSLGDWFIAIILIIITSLVTLRISMSLNQFVWGIRSGILSIIGGLLFYIYLAFGFPGSNALINNLGFWGVILFTISGSIAGILSSIGWHLYQKRIRSSF